MGTPGESGNELRMARSVTTEQSTETKEPGHGIPAHRTTACHQKALCCTHPCTADQHRVLVPIFLREFHSVTSIRARSQIQLSFVPHRTLLQPILSLSRPSSPGPPSPGSEPPPPTEEPADRSASSLPAHFPPRAESDPAPTVESQGFVLYVGSLMAYVMFLVWSLCPDEWLERLGIEWYPSR